MASTFSLTLRVVYEHGAAGPGRGPAATGSDEAERRELGVAVDDPHVFERHAHLVGGDLRQRRLVALAVRGLCGDDEEVAVRLEADLGPLAAERPRRASRRDPAPLR